MNNSIQSTILKDWENWDGDDECLQFYDGVIQIDTLTFKKGDKIPVATFLNSESKLQLFNKQDSLTGVPTEELDLILTAKTK